MIETRAAPRLYFDLGSPYAYLAVERAARVLGMQPELEPVLLGAIFRRRGYGSWSATPARAERLLDLQERAMRYQLPPFHWPPGWPADGLAAMRCAVWAKLQGSLASFAREVFRREFVHAGDIADIAVLHECARAAGLDAGAMESSLSSSQVKDALRAATAAAWDAGVRGVPTLRLGGTMFYGDDQLESAAAALRGAGAL
jgi:2-hydroxychromene-2-carboxylate isomerase